MNRWKRRATRGATAVEYAIIAGFVGLVIVASLGAMGDTLLEVFEDIGLRMNGTE